MRGKPFEPGNTCGRGRPKGSRNQATIALQHMLDGHGEAITKKCALMALQGDPVALRLCMDRLLAPRREPPAKFRLAPVDDRWRGGCRRGRGIAGCCRGTAHASGR